jgi:pSer/pThr/pTyr-binding forkhead associated (FHA) protein
MDQSPPQADDTRPDAPRVVPLRLVLQPGGAVVRVDGPEAVVGRHSEADVRLPLPDVSRRHCRFVWEDGRWQVRDLQSLNGVYVNDEKVVLSALKSGDRVRIGGFTFAVELGETSPTEADAPAAALESIVRALPPAQRPPQRRRLAS